MPLQDNPIYSYIFYNVLQIFSFCKFTWLILGCFVDWHSLKGGPRPGYEKEVGASMYLIPSVHCLLLLDLS